MWVSNGDNSSPNEEKLLGERVIVRQGKREWRGILKMVKAHTRGNLTLAVVYRQLRPSDGKMVRREQTIWMLRDKPFTIEMAPTLVDVPRD